MKTLEGLVVSSSMINTAVVEVVTYRPHPLYKKLQKRSKRFKADTKEVSGTIGDTVVIGQTRPISKDKHFKIIKVVKKAEVTK